MDLDKIWGLHYLAIFMKEKHDGCKVHPIVTDDLKIAENKQGQRYLTTAYLLPSSPVSQWKQTYLKLKKLIGFIVEDPLGENTILLKVRPQRLWWNLILDEEIHSFSVVEKVNDIIRNVNERDSLFLPLLETMSPKVEAYLYATFYDRPLPKDRPINWGYYNFIGRWDSNLFPTSDVQKRVAEMVERQFLQELPRGVQHKSSLPGFTYSTSFRPDIRQINYPVLVYRHTFKPDVNLFSPWRVIRFHRDDQGCYTVVANPPMSLPAALKKGA